MSEVKLNNYLDYKSDYRFQGQKVKSTKSYFERTGRKITGTVVEARTYIGENDVIVRWDTQEGNIEPNLVGCMVLMDLSSIETADFVRS